MQKYKFLLILLPFFIILSSCREKDRFHPDISAVHANLMIHRYDSELVKLDENNYLMEFRHLNEKYPLMTEFFIEQIARAGKVDDSMSYYRLKPVIFDRYTQELYEETEKRFADFHTLIPHIQKAFDYLKYYYPDTVLPEIYTTISNFGFSAATYESILSVSLDMYLGNDYRYYDGLFSKYQYRHFVRQQLVPDIVRVMFTRFYPEDSFAGNNLLSKMIYHGKMALFLKMMIPDCPDTIIHKYSEKQLDWAEKYEGQIWHQLVENKVLFETETYKISRYLDDAPFTNAYKFPQECPPRIAAWVGYRIIENYLKKYPDVNLIDFLAEKDYNKILNLSQYKPKL
ncbi:MAG: hypothetical protein GX437_05895 [Sphingobacteriales bacterium]|nr:hypothetical protein [Sphingobacteriales bacterium]